jgi:DNA-binding GntR family transcriptional regulator
LAEALAARRLRRRSLSDDVADTLRDMILAGELHPEQRITQEELAGGLGVSTMPVREALLRLSHEGMVEASPNRSFRVVRHTREDIRDIYWIHATLSGELAARACARQAEVPGLVERLHQHHRELTEGIAGGDTERMERANWAFHREINLAANSPRLLMMLGGTLRLIPQHFYALLEGWAPASESGHGALLIAFERGDAAAAREAAAQHVRDAGELLVAHFSDRGYWTPPQAR